MLRKQPTTFTQRVRPHPYSNFEPRRRTGVDFLQSSSYLNRTFAAPQGLSWYQTNKTSSETSDGIANVLGFEG